MVANFISCQMINKLQICNVVKTFEFSFNLSISSIATLHCFNRLPLDCASASKCSILIPEVPTYNLVHYSLFTGFTNFITWCEGAVALPSLSL